MNRKQLSIIALALTLSVSLAGCGKKDAIGILPPDESTGTVTAAPTAIQVSDLQPLADKGVIVGIKDMNASDGTPLDLAGGLVVDQNIITNVSCEDHSDYTKSGTYDAVFTITFDHKALNDFVEKNQLHLNFKVDENANAVMVKVSVVVTLPAAEDPDAADPAPEVTPEKPDKPEESEKPKPEKPKPEKPKPEKPEKPDKPDKPDKPTHKHRYSSAVTRQPTCVNTGVRTFTCSCGKSYTESIPAADHRWVHHDEVGHNEEVKVPVYTEHVICNQCGRDCGVGADGISAAEEHFASSPSCSSYRIKKYLVGYKVSNQWVVDSPAHDSCSVCGTRKD